MSEGNPGPNPPSVGRHLSFKLLGDQPHLDPQDPLQLFSDRRPVAMIALMGQAFDRIRRQLKRTLKQHESANANLKTLRDQIETEIELHDLLLSLGRNELLLDYFGQLEEDFSRAASLKSNGLSDEERHSMQIPTGVSFEVGPDAESLADCKMLVRHRTWLIEIAWHDQLGLIARPIEGHRGAALSSLSSETSEEECSLRPPERET